MFFLLGCASCYILWRYYNGVSEEAAASCREVGREPGKGGAGPSGLINETAVLLWLSVSLPLPATEPRHKLTYTVR